MAKRKYYKTNKKENLIKRVKTKIKFKFWINFSGIAFPLKIDFGHDYINFELLIFNFEFEKVIKRY